MNRGTLGGVTPNSWVNYTPRVLCASNGAVTAPSLGTGLQRGRWLRLAQGLVVTQLQVTFSTGLAVGAGDCYVIELPTPANRWVTGVPLPIGQAMIYRTVTATPRNVFVNATLADQWTSLAGESDQFFQMYSPGTTTVGTGTWAANTDNVIVPHAQPFTPNAEDIEFWGTSAVTAPATNAWPLYVSAIDSSNFQVTTQSGNTSTATFTYEWRCRSEPTSANAGSWLVGPNRPLTVAGGSLAIFAQVYYEPKG